MLSLKGNCFLLSISFKGSSSWACTCSRCLFSIRFCFAISFYFNNFQFTYPVNCFKHTSTCTARFEAINFIMFTQFNPIPSKIFCKCFKFAWILCFVCAFRRPLLSDLYVWDCIREEIIKIWWRCHIEMFQINNEQCCRDLELGIRYNF